MDFEEVINFGNWVLNPSPCNEKATIAVTGLGRSGTTMTAQILQELGVFMGEPLTHVCEELYIREALQNRDEHQFKQICIKYNLENDKWGFKNSKLGSQISKFLPYMRSPRIIIIFRDILSISIRNNITMDFPLLETLLNSIAGYKKIVAQIELCKCPILLLSYEKTLQFPERSVEAIASFCGINVDESKISKVAQLIVNGEKIYLSNCFKRAKETA